MPYVTDTHSLVWHMTGDPRLSNEAKRVFDRVDNTEDQVFIPCIVFFELLYLVEKKKLQGGFGSFLAMVSSSENYKTAPLCLPVIENARRIPRERVADPWDRLIAGTAMHLNLPLISRDKSLREIGLEIIW